jgi:GNAT superfamily N-acetyltransferase
MEAARIMDQLPSSGLTRKLWPVEYGLLRDHFLRLDADSRRERFGAAVSDVFVERHVADLARSGGLAYAYMAGGSVRGAAELRRVGDLWRGSGEAAFSVESGWRDHGIGGDLLGRIIRAARNRGMRRIVMNCLLENRRMQHVARKYEAELRFDHGEVVGELTRGPNIFSLWREQVEDRMGLTLAVLEVPRADENAA